MAPACRSVGTESVAGINRAQVSSQKGSLWDTAGIAGAMVGDCALLYEALLDTGIVYVWIQTV